MDFTLSKTDFKDYLICPKCFWLKKKRPDKYQEVVDLELSLFEQKLIRDGYEVEKYARDIFPNGEYGKEFQVKEGELTGVMARIDIINLNPETGKWDLYEVKSSSEVKNDLKHNHLNDLTFQTVVLKESGVDVGKTYIVHINREYVRNGDINPFELLVLSDQTINVWENMDEVKIGMKSALEILDQEDIDVNECGCLYKSAGQRCSCFSIFNPQVPEYSVHNILMGSKLKLLINDNIFDPKDIPEDFDLTDRQKSLVEVQKIGKPRIDQDGIREDLDSLQYPIYFLDYETFAKPIPVLDGYKPNQQLVFQFSLHILHESGELEHKEYLADNIESSTDGLVKAMKEYIGPVGSVIVWHESFEKGRNDELGQIHPEAYDFFRDLNNRIYDLKVIFTKKYLHPDFKGSASIKKVLPVLVPELTYKDLDIQNGTMALSEWGKMVGLEVSKKEGELSEEKKLEIRSNLLKYCELDTLAMVKIFEVLKEI
jgi:CRISPR/Cas system-associated exonuclease Cas4 (RecB family)